MVTILGLLIALTWSLVAHAQNKGAVAAAKAAADEREQQLDAQAMQYVQMMQPIMWRELDFARQVCELPPEARPKVKAAGEAALKQAARDMIQPQRVPRGRTPATARQTIASQIAKALEANLAKDQLARYQAEAERRQAADKDAAIKTAVAQVDTALFLNEEQREKIVKALSANWQDGWEQWLMLWQYSGQYYPQIPDQHVTPHLTDEQKTVWRGLQKVNFSSWGGQQGRQAGDDAWWEGKPQASKAKAKVKAKPKAAQASP